MNDEDKIDKKNDDKMTDDEKDESPMSNWLKKMATMCTTTTTAAASSDQTTEPEEDAASSYNNEKCKYPKYPEWLIQSGNEEFAVGMEAINYDQIHQIEASEREKEEEQPVVASWERIGCHGQERTYRRFEYSPTSYQIPSGPYPYKANTHKQFLEIFNAAPKAKMLNTSKLTKCPHELWEWECRIVNMESYFVDDGDTIDFEWDDPAFQEQQRSFHENLNHVYSFVKNVPSCKLKCDYELEVDAKDTERAAVVDLGDKGFFRCIMDMCELETELDDVPVHLVDINKSRMVPASSLYECLKEFADFPAKYSNLFLYQFAFAQTMDRFRYEVYQYFKKAGSAIKYKAVFQFENSSGIPIVDLYTLDNPPAYVNDLIAARMIDALPGPKLPPAHSGICDVLVSHVEPNGEVFLQIQSQEHAWFNDMTREISWWELRKIICEYDYQKWKPNPLDKDTIYYTIFYMDNNVYRVKLLTLEPLDPKMAKYRFSTGPDSTKYPPTKCLLLAYFMDFGNYALVDPRYLIPVDFILPTLSRFKPQAIKASLAKINSLQTKSFWEIHNDKTLLTIEVLREGNIRYPLPVIDIMNTTKENRGEARTSEILRNQAHCDTILFKSMRYGPYYRQPQPCDALAKIDLKNLCWTRPPQALVMLGEEINVRVVVTAVHNAENFIIETAINTKVWDKMEHKLNSWRRMIDEGVEFQIEELREQNYYCCLDVVTKRYMRVLYTEELQEKKKQPFRSKFRVEVRENPLLDDVVVYAIDHAKLLNIKKHQLKAIPRKFCILPPRGLRASIQNDATWTAEQVKLFSKVVTGRTFLFRINKLECQKGWIPHATGDLYHLLAFDSAGECIYRNPNHDPPDPKFKLSLIELGHFEGLRPEHLRQTRQTEGNKNANIPILQPQPLPPPLPLKPSSSKDSKKKKPRTRRRLDY